MKNGDVRIIVYGNCDPDWFDNNPQSAFDE
jgi:hypothetical protein